MKDGPLSGSVQIARRLLRRERQSGSGAEGALTAAELQRTCTRLTANLRDTLGAEGCTALFARALARTEEAHPALKSVRRIARSDLVLEDVAASVETYGIAAVTEALEAFLAALVDVLGRIIGEDMAIRILMLPDQAPDPRHQGDAS